MERYLRKYGDAALIENLKTIAQRHDASRENFSHEISTLMVKIIDATETYIKEEINALLNVVNILTSRVPEFKGLRTGGNFGKSRRGGEGILYSYRKITRKGGRNRERSLCIYDTR